MKQKGEDPNVVTYSSLIDGHCLQGQMDEAMKVFNCMAGRGVLPSHLTYNILINGYC